MVLYGAPYRDHENKFGFELTKMSYIDETAEVDMLIVMKKPRSPYKKMALKTLGLTISILAVAFVVWAHCGYPDRSSKVIIDDDSSCGGILKGDDGVLIFNSKGGSTGEDDGTICAWVLKIHSTQNIQFTLNNLDPLSTVSLYLEPKSGQRQESVNSSTKNVKKLDHYHLVPRGQKKILSRSDIDSPFQFLGQTLIVAMSREKEATQAAEICFSWKAVSEVPKNVGTDTSGSHRVINQKDHEGQHRD